MKYPIMHPVNQKKRDEPLPWQYPKSLEEDTEAHKRIEKILKSPGYIIAEEDKDFLQEHETLGVRLDLDYLKAELLLQKHGIEHTIVVFGSTRITEDRSLFWYAEEAQEIWESLLKWHEVNKTPLF